MGDSFKYPSGSASPPQMLLREPWRVGTPTLITATTALSAITAYTHNRTKPTSSGTTTVIDLHYPAQFFEMKFFGADTNNDELVAQVFALERLVGTDLSGPLGQGEEWIGGQLFRLDLTLGQAAVNTSSVLLPKVDASGNACTWVDVIAANGADETVGASLRFYQDPVDGAAIVQFDCGGKDALLIETPKVAHGGTVGTASGFIYRQA